MGRQEHDNMLIFTVRGCWPLSSNRRNDPLLVVRDSNIRSRVQKFPA